MLRKYFFRYVPSPGYGSTYVLYYINICVFFPHLPGTHVRYTYCTGTRFDFVRKYHTCGTCNLVTTGTITHLPVFTTDNRNKKKNLPVFTIQQLHKVERGRLTNGNRGITWWVKTFVISFCRVHGNLGFQQTHGCGPIHNGPRVGLNGALPAVDRRFF